MSYAHHTPYFAYAPIKSKILSIFNQNVLIITYIYKIEYPITSGGLGPQTPYFRDTILGLAPPLSKS